MVAEARPDAEGEPETEPLSVVDGLTLTLGETLTDGEPLPLIVAEAAGAPLREGVVVTEGVPD